MPVLMASARPRADQSFLRVCSLPTRGTENLCDRFRIGYTCLQQLFGPVQRHLFLAAEAGGVTLLPLAIATKSACALVLGQPLVGAPVDANTSQRCLRSGVDRHLRATDHRNAEGMAKQVVTMPRSLQVRLRGSRIDG